MDLLEMWFLTPPLPPSCPRFEFLDLSSCKPLCTDVSLGPAALHMLAPSLTGGHAYLSSMKGKT